MLVIQQLDNLRFRQPTQRPLKALQLKTRKLQRALIRLRRKAVATAKSQYYLTRAFRDAKRAFWLNEDIALASIIVVSFLSLGTLSLIDNALYVFMVTAQTVSELLEISIVFPTVIALSVFAVVAGWILAVLQNVLSVSLMEGATRKKQRSLITTFRKSLRLAARTAAAWLTLLAVTMGPLGISMLAFAIGSYNANIPTETALPYFIGLLSLGLCWAIWSLTSFALAPYVLLFENVSNWREAFKRSYGLTKRKGRMFVLSLYLAILASLGGVHFIATGIEKVTGLDYTLTLWLMGAGTIFSANTLLTMLYRKRKLARK